MIWQEMGAAPPPEDETLLFLLFGRIPLVGMYQIRGKHKYIRSDRGEIEITRATHYAKIVMPE